MSFYLCVLVAQGGLLSQLSGSGDDCSRFCDAPIPLAPVLPPFLPRTVLICGIMASISSLARPPGAHFASRPGLEFIPLSGDASLIFAYKTHTIREIPVASLSVAGEERFRDGQVCRPRERFSSEHLLVGDQVLRQSPRGEGRNIAAGRVPHDWARICCTITTTPPWDHFRCKA